MWTDPAALQVQLEKHGTVVDKEALDKYNMILKPLLALGMLKMRTLADGLRLLAYPTKCNLSKLSAFDKQSIKNQSTILKKLLIDVGRAQRNSSSGVRLPQWLKDLVSARQASHKSSPVSTGPVDSDIDPLEEESGPSDTEVFDDSPKVEAPKRPRKLLRRVSTLSSGSGRALGPRPSTASTVDYGEQDNAAQDLQQPSSEDEAQPYWDPRLQTAIIVDHSGQPIVADKLDYDHP